MTTAGVDWGARHTRVVHSGPQSPVTVLSVLTCRDESVLLGPARYPHPDDVVVTGTDLQRALHGTGAPPLGRPVEELVEAFFGLIFAGVDDDLTDVVLTVPHGWLLPGAPGRDSTDRLRRICAAHCRLPVTRVVGRATAALAHVIHRNPRAQEQTILVADLGTEPAELTRFDTAGGLLRPAVTATGADVDAVVARALTGVGAPDGVLGVLLTGAPEEVAAFGEMVLAAVRARHLGPVAELTRPGPEASAAPGPGPAAEGVGLIAEGAALIAEGTAPVVDVLAEPVEIGAHRWAAGQPHNEWLPAAAPFTLRAGETVPVAAGPVRVDISTSGLPVRVGGRMRHLPLHDGLHAGDYRLAVRLDETGLDVVLHTGDPESGHRHRVPPPTPDQEAPS
ncbi:hypothetical protein ACIA8K_29170 [Catenuloplanes sp. NPDC051500]|uniref:hypothetical protein n=1 Tax=Catenuloplanes sp. NPDC051500 TaxID=3363959 RepID=UPI0037A5867B